VKLDAILVVEDNRDFAAQIENFEIVKGIEFPKRLKINANIFKGKTLAQYNAGRYDEANKNNKVTHVSENLSEIIIHEYGHLLTTPNTEFADFKAWMEEMKETINTNDGLELTYLKDSRYQQSNNISDYSSDAYITGNGAEMLAEIFCRHRKNLKGANYLVAPEWAKAFNDLVLIRLGKNGNVATKLGNNLR